MERNWYSYKTKNGITLFYYNSESGEHRWANGFEPPQCSKARLDEIPLIQMCEKGPKMTKKKKKTRRSIATETEEHILARNSRVLNVRDIGINTEPSNSLGSVDDGDDDHDGDGEDRGTDYTSQLHSQRHSDLPFGNPFTTDQTFFRTEDIVEQEFAESNKGSLVDNLFAMELSSVLSSDDKVEATSLSQTYRQTSGDGTDEDQSSLMACSDSHTTLFVPGDPRPISTKKNVANDSMQSGSTKKDNTSDKGCYLGLVVGKEGQIYVKSEPDDEGSGIHSPDESRFKLGMSDDDGNDGNAAKFSISEFLPSLPANDSSNSNDKPSGFQCSKCQRTFKKLSHLQRHSLIHTKKKPYACTMCDKRFRESNCLKKHIRTHTGEKPYHCSVCDKAFSQSQNLNKHMNIHTGNKPHKCKECGKAFTQHGGLSRHKLIHTGEKPFRCTKCGKAYRTSSHLVRHYKSSKHARTSLGQQLSPNANE